MKIPQPIMLPNVNVTAENNPMRFFPSDDLSEESSFDTVFFEQKMAFITNEINEDVESKLMRLCSLEALEEVSFEAVHFGTIFVDLEKIP